MTRLQMSRTAKALGVVLCLVLAISLSPAANAAFNANAKAAVGFATATLPPATDSTLAVAAVCGSNKKSLTLSVGAKAAIAYANELQVIVSSGGVSSTTYQGLSESSRTFTAAQGGSSVVFTYEIRPLYRPLGSTNFWRSQVPFSGTYTC
ncbi:hypothetical protein QFZ36_001461 [Pseudarthrobacter siccitolerans]|uniref:Uncharacterized protein n=1 Tax=Pseudarthrobacter siccitolerans TaxID=861266 RepID=A0ABU0PIW1_9MICC|nr:hypothetical protein [Pseudarthrobacter siccitolerans]MDQ0673900.1 hypothetical protein [Pseudarthrobacter siccitolerans]